jgi:hypothetical protein
MNILYFNQINPLYYSPLPFLPYLLLFNNFQCISLCHIPTQMHCILILFVLYYSLFLFLLSIVPSNSPSITNMLYICIYIVYICIWSYLYLCAYLLALSSTYKRKYAVFVFLNLAYLTWCSPPVPIIYLKTT